MATLVYDTGVYGDTYGEASVSTTPPVSILDAKPPLDLHAEVVTADGTRFRWGSSVPDPADIVQGIQFANKRYEGFERSSCALTRPIDRDYPDLGLFDSLNFIGYDGSVAHEGYISQIPRSTPYGIDVEATGWMASARHQKFRDIYVDHGMEHWGEAHIQRRVNLSVAGYSLGQWSIGVGVDASSSQAITMQTGDLPQPGAIRQIAEYWYDSQGIPINQLHYEFASVGLGNGLDVNWNTAAFLSSDNVATSLVAGTDHNGANGPVAGVVTAANDGFKYGILQVLYNATYTGGPITGGWNAYWKGPHVHGRHGLTPTADAGYYVSDIMRDICSRFCPRLNPSGIQATTWPVQQAAWFDRTDPYDAWLELNKYHLWELAVWENRTLHYHGSDLTDYDWQVKSTDPGVSWNLQGPATDHLANYVTVRFQNLRTGSQDEVSPDTHPELRDSDVENPANRHGLDVELGVTLSQPNDPDGAAQIGRALLAEHNAPKDIGTITVKGHIRDRAGHWQPGWKVRSGDTIAITNFPNSRPRLIGEVAWNHADKTATIAVDSTLKRVDAYLDRFGTALKAAGVQQ